MSVYVCRYLGSKGVTDVEIEAATRDEALTQLRAKGKPISIEEKEATSQDIKLFGGKKKIKTKDLSIFCKQLSVMLNSGIALNNAISVLENQTENKKMKAVLKELDGQLKEGNLLSAAMKRQGEVFPELLVRMVEAGEKTGRLDTVLEKMSIHYTKEIKINNQIRGAMIYPIVLLVMAFVAVLVMLYKVVPAFSGVFESANMELPAITQLVINASNFLQNYWYIFFGVLGGLGYTLHRYAKTDAGKHTFAQLKMNAPILKKPVQQIITARFSSTLAILISAGIPLVDALDAAAKTTNNVIVVDRMAVANEGIQKGRPITEMLTETELFPPMMLSMVKIGEESGSIESMLNKTSDYYDEELEAAIKQLLSLMEPAMIILMGVVIGFIVAAIMIPIFEINNAVYNAGSS